MDIWVPTFWLLWVMLLPKLVYKYLFEFLLSIGTAGSMVILFLTFWGLSKLFHSGRPISHSDQQCRKLPISQHPCQHLLLSGAFLRIAILMGVKWYFMVLICISLMTNAFEHHFICLLAICMPSLKKCLLKSFAYLWIGLISCFWVMRVLHIYWH